MNSGYLFTMGLWIVAVVLQTLNALILIRRGLVGKFRYFFAYCLCTLGRDLALLLLQHSPYFYYWIYWVGEALLIVLQLLVLWEVFRSLLPDHPRFRVFARRAFQSFVVLSLALVAELFINVVRSNGDPTDAVLQLERSARAGQVLMFVVAMMFVSHSGLAWRRYATGILLGSGIAGLQLVPVELRTSLHVISNTTFTWLKPAVYDCAVVAWSISLVLPQKPPVELTGRLQADLNEWDEALKGFLYR